MSSDEDERVKLYNPLERNRKRQHFGACLVSLHSAHPFTLTLRLSPSTLTRIHSLSQLFVVRVGFGLGAGRRRRRLGRVATCAQEPTPRSAPEPPRTLRCVVLCVQFVGFLSDGASVRLSASGSLGTVDLDNDDDDDDGVDVETLMTEAERAAARASALRIEREIAQRMAQDALLSQTRAIMRCGPPLLGT